MAERKSGPEPKTDLEDTSSDDTEICDFEYGANISESDIETDSTDDHEGAVGGVPVSPPSFYEETLATAKAVKIGSFTKYVAEGKIKAIKGPGAMQAKNKSTQTNQTGAEARTRPLSDREAAQQAADAVLEARAAHAARALQAARAAQAARTAQAARIAQAARAAQATRAAQAARLHQCGDVPVGGRQARGFHAARGGRGVRGGRPAQPARGGLPGRDPDEGPVGPRPAGGHFRGNARGPQDRDRVATVTLFLTNKDNFDVHVSGHYAPLNNYMSGLPQLTRHHYDSFVKNVGALAPRIELLPLPRFVLRMVREQIPTGEDIDLSSIEPILRDSLSNFQKEGVRFALVRGGRCIIADEMGLGKTHQALAIASFYKPHWPLLIVTTPKAREVWRSKLSDLMPSIPAENILTVNRMADMRLVDNKETRIVLINYKMAGINATMLRSKKFNCIIFDDSNELQCLKMQCARALRVLCADSFHVILLTGNPPLDHPNQLYAQLLYIDDDDLPSFVEFGKRYCNGQRTNHGWDMTGQSHLQELQLYVYTKYMIRRTKEQVQAELEKRTREAITLDKNTLIQNKKAERTLKKLIRENFEGENTDKYNLLIPHFNTTARMKIPAIIKYILNAADDLKTKKFLILAHHTCIIQAICRTLDRIELNYVQILQSTKIDVKEELIQRFQASEESICGVVGITAAKACISLPSAELVLFAELFWNPAVLVEAESYVHRLNTQNPVNVRYLIAESTADDFMWELLQEKFGHMGVASKESDAPPEPEPSTSKAADEMEETKYDDVTKEDNRDEDDGSDSEIDDPIMNVVVTYNDEVD